MSKSSLEWGLFLSAIVLLALFPLYSTRYAIVFFTTIFMYTAITVSWTIFSGPTGYISLASAAFFGVGVYTSALLGFSLPMPALIGIGALASACLALLVGALTLRLSGIFFVMFTFGLVELLLHFVVWWEVTISETTGRVVPSVDNATVYYLMLAVVAASVLAAWVIKRSRFGLALQGIGECEEAAAHTGVNVVAVKIASYAVSAFFMGAAGAIMATRWTYIDPKIAFNPIISFLPVLMAIFGGMGQLYGPVAGAVMFTCLEQFLITRFPYYYMLIFGIIMVTAILYLPDGLVGLISRVATWRYSKEEG